MNRVSECRFENVDGFVFRRQSTVYPGAERFRLSTKPQPIDFCSIDSENKVVEKATRPEKIGDSRRSIRYDSRGQLRRSTRSFRERQSLSSLGGANITPHPVIPVGDFHKHISIDLPAPVRMRQLILWCINKVVEESSSDDIIKNISESVVKALMLRRIDIYFTHNKHTEESKTVQNPKNAEIAEHLSLYRNLYDRLDEEKETWITLISNVQGLLSPTSPPEPQDIEENLAHRFRGYKEKLEDYKKWIHRLRMKIDSMHQTLAMCRGIEGFASDYYQGLFRQIYVLYISKKEVSREDPLNILKALSSLKNK